MAFIRSLNAGKEAKPAADVARGAELGERSIGGIAQDPDDLGGRNFRSNVSRSLRRPEITDTSLPNRSLGADISEEFQGLLPFEYECAEAPV